ncbi:Sugar lactone lactonase YvrE [Palleronia salina]|uniref:Sugar lactone lactonase YvrE n=1 Tax=Palleronia salina TaxID=313368 RepID=A0A1M6KN69_9RHOB|nr:Sugar lactone lactonase YvrE [Palleronia salina]
MTVAPSALVGDTIEVTYTVTNVGATVLWPGTETVTDEIWLTADFPLPDNQQRARPLSIQRQPLDTPLGAGESYTRTVQYTLPPMLAGDYHVSVIANRDGGYYPRYPTYEQFPDRPDDRISTALGGPYRGRVYEPFSDNNIGSAAIAVGVAEADLVVTSVSAPDAAQAGSTIDVTVEIENRGGRATRVDRWSDLLALSIDTTLDATDIALSGRAGGDPSRFSLASDPAGPRVLAPGESYTATFSVYIPHAAEGELSLLAIADAAHLGTSGRDQGFLPLSRGLGTGDLLRFTGPPVDGEPLNELRYTTTGQVDEYSAEGNNVFVHALRVTPAEAPDIVADLSLAPRLVSGEYAEAEVTLRNRGGPLPAEQDSWSYRLWLTRDEVLSVDDKPLTGGFGPLQLDADASESQTVRFRVPPGLEPGAWRIAVEVDVPGMGAPNGFVLEGAAGEANNLTLVPVQIDAPPPADLVPVGVGLPAGLVAGDEIDIAWEVVNAGENATGPVWSDAIYLSQDGTLDADDVLLVRARNEGALAAGESLSRNLRIRVPALAEGEWRVLLRTDLLDEVAEGAGEATNTVVTPRVVTVTVPRVSLSEPVEFELAPGVERLVKVEVPLGQTLRASLTALEGPLGAPAGDLMVGYLDPPDPTDPLAADTARAAGQSVAIVPGTQPGDHYIRLRGLEGGATRVRLETQLVPLSIDDVSVDRLGAGAWVTTEIRGAQFAEGATVRLSRPGFAAHEPAAWRVVDSGRILASFDLTGAERGLYDVSVTNPDGSTAILPYRVMIDPPRAAQIEVALDADRIMPKWNSVHPIGVALRNASNLDAAYVHFRSFIPEMGENILVFDDVSGRSARYGDAIMAQGDALSGAGPFEVLDPTSLVGGRHVSTGFAFGLGPGVQARADMALHVYPGVIDPSPEEIRAMPYDTAVAVAATPMTRAEFVDYQRELAEALRQAVLADPDAAPQLFALAADGEVWGDLFIGALEEAGLLRPDAEVPPVRERPLIATMLSTLAQGAIAGPLGGAATGEGGARGLFEALTALYAGESGVQAAMMGLDPVQLPEHDGSPRVPTLPAELFDQGFAAETASRQLRLFMVPYGDTIGAEVGASSSPEQLLRALGPDAIGGQGQQALDLRQYLIDAGRSSGRATLVGPDTSETDGWLPFDTDLPFTLGVAAPESGDAVRSLRATVPLDPDLDPASLRLSDIRLGEIGIDVPAGAQRFQTEIDLRASRGFVLRVSAGIDLLAPAPTATWLIEAIDPATGLALAAGPQGLLRPGETAELGWRVSGADAPVSGPEVTARAVVLMDDLPPEEAASAVARLDLRAPATALEVTDLGAGRVALDWQASDDIAVRHVTLYAAAPDAPWRILARRVEGATGSFLAEDVAPGTRFLAVATDLAGNVERPAFVTELPADGPPVDLGAPPDARTTPSDPPAARPGPAPTNPLFLAALADTVSPFAADVAPSAFGRLGTPFAGEAFATDIPASAGGIGALAVLELADGRVWVTGGPARADLWQLDLENDGAAVQTPLATLDAPIHGLAQGPDGRVWAATGGGALLELDRTSGAVIARHGSAVGTAVAVSPVDGTIVVAGVAGAAQFDPATGQFTPLGRDRDLRLGALAFDDAGVLWGVSWPGRDRVVRMDETGRLETVHVSPHAIDSLAFGRKGTALENLLFVSSVASEGTPEGTGAGAGGVLTLIDPGSGDAVEIARDGLRGEGIATTSDGRVLVAQGGSVDAVLPVFAPEVEATTPAADDVRVAPLPLLEIRFDQRMLDAEPGVPGSVRDPANYALRRADGTTEIPEFVVYSAETRTAFLGFGALPGGDWTLIADGAANAYGVPLQDAFEVDFTLITDLSSILDLEISATRFDRSTGEVSFDIALSNTSDRAIKLPVLLTLDAEGGLGAPASAADAIGDGFWTIDLSGLLPQDGILGAGATTTGRTLQLNAEGRARADLLLGAAGDAGPNKAPEFDVLPDLAELVPGTPWSFDLQASDPDGDTVLFGLLDGPDGMTIDAVTGTISWTPPDDAPARVTVTAQAFDPLGAARIQRFTLDLQGGNAAPEFSNLPAELRARVGQPIELRVQVSDSDDATFAVFADGLPPGAQFDPETRILRWVPQPGQTGVWPDLRLIADDGTARSVAFLPVVVETGALPLELRGPDEASVAEGGRLVLRFEGSGGAEGRAVRFEADRATLPPGAQIDARTGTLSWTPGYDQAGTWDATVAMTDGISRIERDVRITVAAANAAPVFFGLDGWQVYEGRSLNLALFPYDADAPFARPPVRLPDGTLDLAPQPLTTTTRIVSGLPPGATYDPDTTELSWIPGPDAAGEYEIVVETTDDGGGVVGGTPITVRDTLTITVLPANTDPILAPLDPVEVARGETRTLTISASDADGDAPALRLETDGPDPSLPRFVTFTDNGDGTGTLTIAPGAGDRGDYGLIVTATDADGGQDVLGFSLRATSENEPPVLGPLFDAVALADQAQTILVPLSDLDGETLETQVTGLPGLIDFAPSGTAGLWALSFRPGAGDLGRHDVSIRATDQGGGGDTPVTVTDSFQLTVRADNAAPRLDPVGDRTVPPGGMLVIDLRGRDLDGDALYYSAEGLPPGATLDPLTGRLEWTPRPGQLGRDNVVLRVSDGAASATETIALRVDLPDRAPVFDPVGPQLVREGDELVVAVGARDPERGEVYLSLEDAPAEMVFDPVLGVARWQPGYGDAGLHTVRVVAQDGAGNSSEQTIEIRVVDVNRAPQLQLEDAGFVIGVPKTVTAVAADADGDALDFTLVEAPDGVSVDEFGVLSWTPRPGQTGDHLIVLRVGDGEATSRVAALWTVRDLPVTPQIRIETTPDFPAVPGQPVLIRAVVDAAAPLVDLRLSVDGQAVARDAAGRFAFTPTAPGRFEIVVTVEDADGNRAEARQDLKVRDPADRDAPALTLADLPDGPLRDPVTIAGTIADTNLDSWRAVLLDRQGRRPPIELASGTAPADGVLAELDPAKLPDGWFVLRVEAVDMGGRRSLRDHLVEIAAPEKTDRQLVETLDATVTLGGVSLELLRRFDGFAAGTAPRGHLAQGWRFATLDMTVETTRALANTAGAGLEAALRTGERARVRLPDGGTAAFTFRPQSVVENGRSFARPAWVPDDPDLGWQLATADAELVRVGGRWYTVAAAAPYNPGAAGGTGDDYRVTGPDGRVYAVDAQRGLTRIVTADGGVLHVSDSGLVGRDGTALRFERDPQGRITRVQGEGLDLSYRVGRDGQLQLVRDLTTGETERLGHDGDGRLRVVTVAGGGRAYDGIDEVGFGADLSTLTGWGTATDPVDFGPDGRVVHALAVRPSEIASAASGRLHLRVSLSGDVTGATLDGLAPLAASADGRSLVFPVDRPGLLALEITGTGSHTVRLDAVGDLDGDADVDADDAALFGAGADVDGDGDADLSDRALFNANFGLRPNLPPRPVADIPTQRTHVDVPIEVDLAALLPDAEGDEARYSVVGAENGTAFILGDRAFFTPTPGVSGEAALIVRGDDGWTLSEPIRIPVQISDAALVSLDFVGRAQVMSTPGMDVPLQLVADFEDAEDVAVPLWWGGITSSDPEIVRITRDGRLVGEAPGHVVITATRGDISAATVAGVAKAQTLDEALTLAGGIDAYPDAVTVLQGTEARRIVTTLGSLGKHFRGKAEQGTRYVVADRRIATVDEDGLIRAVAPGETTVTVLHAFGEETIAVKVLDAPGTADATVGTDGAIVQTDGGARLAIAPGSLPDGTRVSMRDLELSDLDAKLDGLGTEPDATWGFLGAFDLEMSRPTTETESPMQIALPVDGAAEEGDTVAFFRRIELPTGADGALEWHWALFDTGTVDGEGLARTASPPFPGLTDRGQVLAARVGFPSKVITIDYATQAALGGLLFGGALLAGATGGLAGLLGYAAAMSITFSINAVMPKDAVSLRLEAFEKARDGEVRSLNYEVPLDTELTFEDIELRYEGDAPPPRVIPGSVSAAYAGIADRPVITGTEIVEVTEDTTRVKLEGFLFTDTDLTLDIFDEFGVEDVRASRIRLSFNGQDFYVDGTDFVDVVLKPGAEAGLYQQEIIFDVPQYVLLGATQIFVERPIIPRNYGFADWPADAEFVTSQPIGFTNKQRRLYVTSRTFGDGGQPDRGFLEVYEPAPLGSQEADTLLRRVPLPRDFLDVGVEIAAAPDGSAMYVATVGAVEVFDTIAQRFVDFSAADPDNIYVAPHLRGIPIPEGPITDMVLSPDGQRLFVSAKASIYEIDLSQGAEFFMQARKLTTLDVEVWDPSGTLNVGGEDSAYNIIHALELSEDGRRLYALTPWGERDLRQLGRSHMKFRESSRFWRSEMHVIDVDPALRDVRGDREVWRQAVDEDGDPVFRDDGRPQMERVTADISLYGAKIGAPVERAGDRANPDRPLFSVDGRWIVKYDARDLVASPRPGVMMVTHKGAFGNGVSVLETASDDPDAFDIRMRYLDATQEQWRGFDPAYAESLGMTRNAYNPWGYNVGETYIDAGGLTVYKYPLLRKQIGTSLQAWDMDIQTAGEVLLDPSGAFAYVIDTGDRSTPDRGLLARIENRTSIGTKIGVIANPLGANPRFLGTTAVFPGQEIKDIALDVTGTRLVATLWHSDTVLGYDTSALLERAFAMQTAEKDTDDDPSRYPIDLYDTTNVNRPGIDVRRPSAIAFGAAGDLRLEPVTEPIVNWGENKSQLRLIFGWDAETPPAGSDRVKLYLSTRAPGLGLFPTDPPLHDNLDDEALKAFKGDYNPGRVWTPPRDFAFVLGRAYEVAVDGTIQDIGAADENDNVNVTFSPDFVEILTAGSTVYWGVQFGTAGARAASSVQVAARASQGDAIAGVTLLTHGFQPFMSVLNGTWSVGYGQPEPLLHMAREISEATGGSAVLLYDKRTGQWVNPETNRTGAEGIEPGRGVVLVSDWVTESDITDEGFSEAAADALFASIMALDADTEGRLLNAPMHMIGHNRGASVNSEIAQRLARFRPDVSDVHVTTLDPFDQSQETLQVPLQDMLLMVRWTNRLAAAVNVAKSVAGAIASGGSSLAIDAVPTMSTLAAQGALEKAINKVFEVAQALGIDVGVIKWDDFKDPDVKRWENVGFHDNYFQTAAKGKKDGSDVTNELAEFFDIEFLTTDDAKKALDAILQAPGEWTTTKRLQYEAVKAKFDLGLGLPGPFTFSANGRSLKDFADYEIDLSAKATGFDIDDFQSDAIGFRFGLNNPTERTLAWYAGTIDAELEAFYDVPLWRRAGDIGLDINPYKDSTADAVIRNLLQSNIFDKKGWYGAQPITLVKGGDAQRDVLTKYEINRPGIIREGVGQGWFWSTGGGGDPHKPLQGDRKVTQSFTDNSEQGAWADEGAVPEIFNGNFEHGTRQSLVNMIASMMDVGAYIDKLAEKPGDATQQPKSAKQKLFGKDSIKALFSGQVTGFGRFPFSYELPGWAFHGGEGFSAGLGSFRSDIAGLFVMNTNPTGVFVEVFDKVFDMYAKKITDAVSKYLVAKVLQGNETIAANEGYRNYQKKVDAIADYTPQKESAAKALKAQYEEEYRKAEEEFRLYELLNPTLPSPELERRREARDRAKERLDTYDERARLYGEVAGLHKQVDWLKGVLLSDAVWNHVKSVEPDIFGTGADGKPQSIEGWLKVQTNGVIDPSQQKSLTAFVKAALKFTFFGKDPAKADNAILMGGSEALTELVEGAFGFVGGAGAMGDFLADIIDELTDFDALVHNRFWIPESGANYLTFETLAPMAIGTDSGVEVLFLRGETTEGADVLDGSPNILHRAVLPLPEGFFERTTHSVAIPSELKGKQVKLMLRNVGLDTQASDVDLTPPDVSGTDGSIERFFLNLPDSFSPAASALSQTYLLDNIRLQATDPGTGVAQEVTAEVAPDTPLAALDAERAECVADAARTLWESTGALTDAQRAQLQTLQVEIRDLGGTVLALFDGNKITLDDDAAGHGWAVPGAGDWQLQNAALRGVDLLTVIAHEMGHSLGLEDLPGAGGTAPTLMTGTLAPGERRLPQAADLATAGEPTRDGVLRLSQVLRAVPRADGTPAGPATRNTTPAQAAATPPTNTDIVNGTFDAAPDPGVGWTFVGDAGVTGGRALIAEGADVFSGVTQAFLNDGTASALELTLSGIRLDADPRRVPDAIEVALRAEETGVPLAQLQALAGTDALLSIQADGRVLVAPGVEIEGTRLADGSYDLTQPITLRVPLDAATAGTAYRLSVDLLGFGSRAAQVAVDDVRLLRDGPVNLAPVAVDDSVGTAFETPVTIDALANDSDPEAAPLVPRIAGAPTNGQIEIVNGTFVYTPDDGFSGQDSFTYVVSDGERDSEPATVTIDVAAETAGPVIADPGSLAVIEGDRLSVELVGIDAGGTGSLSWTLVSGPTGATLDPVTGQLSWQAPDGPDRVELIVALEDGAGRMAERRVAVDVADARPRIIVTGAAEVTRGAAFDLALAITDPGADTISAIIIDWGDGSSSTLPGDARAASHVFDRDGRFEIAVTVVNEDGRFAGPDTAVRVNAPPVDSDAPRVTDFEPTRTVLTVTMDRPMGDLPDGAVTLSAAGGRVIAGAVALSGDGLQLVFTPSRPLPTGDYVLRIDDSWRARPGAGGLRLDGDDDGAEGGDAVLDLRVRAGTSVPVARPDSARTNAGEAVQLDVLANDTDPGGDALSVDMVDDPANGDVSILPDGRILYTPKAGFAGTDRFRYRATDGQASSDPVDVTIDVAPIDGPEDPPERPETPDTPTPVVADPPRDGPTLVGDPGSVATLTTGPRLVRVSMGNTGTDDLYSTPGRRGGGGGGGSAELCRVNTATIIGGRVAVMPGVIEPGHRFTLVISDGAPAGLSIDWGDGTVVEIPEGARDITHSYEDEGLKRITFILQDAVGVERVTQLVSVGTLDPVRVVSAEMRGGRIVVTFSRAIDPATLEDGTLRLVDGAGRPVSIRTILSDDRRQLTLVIAETPTGPLSLVIEGTAAGVLDLVGCAIDGDANGTPGGAYQAIFELDVRAEADPLPRLRLGTGLALAGAVERRGRLLGVPLRADAKAVAISAETDTRPVAPQMVDGGTSHAGLPVIGSGSTARVWFDASELGDTLSITTGETAVASSAEPAPRAALAALAPVSALAGALSLTADRGRKPNRRASAAVNPDSPERPALGGRAAILRIPLPGRPET